jgi:hypothetical protein
MKGRSLLYLFSSLVLLLSMAAQSQNLHFIYIQTENKKPFFVKIDGQTIPSSAAGYTIIPRLTQANYKSYIGFPKTELPVLGIDFVIGDTDAGYLLKSDVDGGLYMISLQTMEFVPTERQWPAVKNSIKYKDEFARILAEVVNDSSINEVTDFKKLELAIGKSEEIKPFNTATAMQPQAIIGSKTVIAKLVKQNTTEGLVLTYLDSADTIDVFMPLIKKNTLVALKVDTKKANTKCKRTATQTDFLNLRKKMAAYKTYSAMQMQATKHFSSICFTTDQIKNLGILFITEAERYKFYVSAYPYVADAANFATLQNQLTNTYYITRFKTMFNH